VNNNRSTLTPSNQYLPFPEKATLNLLRPALCTYQKTTFNLLGSKNMTDNVLREPAWQNIIKTPKTLDIQGF